MVTLDTLDTLSMNGVVTISDIAKVNIPLATYVKENLKSIEDRNNFLVLDDTAPVRGEEYLIKYLTRKYGNTVDLTELRTHFKNVYKAIISIDSPENFLTKHGFKYVYGTQSTVDEIVEELAKYSSGNIIVRKIPKELDNKIRYRARKEGTTFRGYLEKLGYFKPYNRID